MSSYLVIFHAWSGKRMDIQKKAVKIIFDITGIVLKWDKKQLSDKEAMDEIVRTLAPEPEKSEEKVVLLDDVEVKEKSSSILVQKKVLAPMVVGIVFFAVLFGISEPFATNENMKIVEENQISFEQLDETASNGIEQNSVNEQFGNKTISKQD